VHYPHVRLLNNYYQVRLLDLSGQELVRVNYIGMKAHLVVQEYLQDKSKRPYFQKTLSLLPHEIYVSPLNLNVENEVVEEPWKPTLRLSTKIYDSRGSAKAILVLNYQATNLLDELAGLEQIHQGSINLLNRQGYWLFGGEKDKSWAFMFDKDYRFGQTYPEAWSKIKGSTHNQVALGEYIVTHETISFPDSSHDMSTASKWLREWKLVSVLPKNIATPNSQKLLKIMAILSPVIGLMLLLVAWFWSRMVVEAKHHQQQNKQLSRVVEQSEELVYITNKQGEIEYVNPAFEAITGYRSYEVVGKTPRILKSGQHDQLFYQKLWKTILKGKPFQDIMVNKRKDGSLYFEQKLITPIHDASSGEIIQFVSTGQDISEVQRMERLRETLQKLAYHDQLTGLPNRNYLCEQLERSTHSAERLNKMIAVFFLDLDGFKQVNDQFGHQAGDSVLYEVAKRLQSIFRKTDTVGRLSGDEFLVIIEFLEDTESVTGLAEQVITEISKPYLINQAEQIETTVTVSIGIVLYPQKGLRPDSLIDRADQAMYLAKHKGKNGYSFASEETDEIGTRNHP